MPPMPTLPKRLPALPTALATALAAALVAGCGSTPPGAAAGGEPMIYVSSPHTPASIASCLADRLPRVRTSQDGGATELTVGSASDPAWFVELTPNGRGSVIRVTHGPASSDPPEEELRFDVARCTT